MTQNGKIDAEWLLLTLNDAAEELAHAINLIEEDPRKAEGVMEHEITALYAKLNYAVNSSRVGPQAAEIMDHDDLVAWPASMPFKSQP